MLSRSFAAARLAARRATITPARGFRSTHTASQTTKHSAKTYAVAAAVGLTTYYLASQPLKADSSKAPVKKGAADKVHAGEPDTVQAKVHGDKKQKKKGAKVSIGDVLEHKEGDEVWVVIKGDVYNMTDFLDDHPGGRDIIEKNRSKDVTPIFNPRHPSDQLEPENLPPNVHKLGTLDIEDASDEEKEDLRLKVSPDEEEEEERIAAEREEMEERGLGVVVNMRDFEKYAEKMVSKVAWAYYASAADDEFTKNDNANAYQKVFFRPRVLRKVAVADASTEILGHKSTIPVFIAPAAMAKLGHPDGEVNLTKGAGNTGIIQAISSNASCSLEEMQAARQNGQPLFFQLYVNRDRNIATDLVKKIDHLGMNAIFLTADAPVGGKRERDLRLKGEFEGPSGGVSIKGEDTQGVSQAMFAGVDPNLNWDDIKWVQSLTDKPVLVKGVQSVEDALLAYEKGAAGILISNHGGRQLDTTRPSLDVLLEIRKYAPHLLRPEYRGATGVSKPLLEHPENLTPPDLPSDGLGPDGKPSRPFEILVDGGIWRGTDVVKALCLGANAVGVGRGFLYAQSVGGVEGVEHAVGILQQEILTTMRLLGANKIDELRPSMVEVKE